MLEKVKLPGAGVTIAADIGGPDNGTPVIMLHGIGQTRQRRSTNNDWSIRRDTIVVGQLQLGASRVKPQSTAGFVTVFVVLEVAASVRRAPFCRTRWSRYCDDGS